MSIKLHERSRQVQMAKSDAALALIKIQEQYGLTYGEVFSILGFVVQDFAKYAIREERHGNDSKKGDEA